MRRKLLKTASAIILSAAMCTIQGCGPFWVNPYITVTESHLNWVHIHYYNLNRRPIRRVSVFLNGMGHVEVKKGTSELVSNDFAKGYANDTWRSIKTYRIDVDPKHVNEIFQNLVNYGLLDREKTGRSSTKEMFDRVIAVKANICNHTYSDQVNIFEADPDLAEQLLDVVREFDDPTK